MAGLTKEQLLQMGAKPVQPKPAKQGFTLEQLKAQQKPTPTPEDSTWGNIIPGAHQIITRPVEAARGAAATGLNAIFGTSIPVNEAGQDIAETAQAVKNTVFEGSADFMRNAAYRPGLTVPQRGAAAVGSLARAGARTIGELGIGLGKLGLSQDQEDDVKRTSEDVASAVAKTGIVQKAQEKYAYLPEGAKAYIEGAAGLGELATSLAVPGAGRAAGTAALKAGEGVVNTVKPLASEAVTAGKSLVQSPVNAAVQATRIKGVDELVGSTKALTRRASDIEKSGTPIREMLAEDGVYRGLKVEGGKVNPDEAVAFVQENVDRAMEVARNILPEIDKYVPAVEKSDIVGRARAYAQEQGLTKADTQDVVNAVERQLSAYGDTLRPSEVDALRAAARNSSRNAKGQLKRDSEYAAIESAARDIVFEAANKLPAAEGAEFSSLRNYIKQNIELQKFLDTNVRGQSVRGGRLGQFTGRLVGGIAGGAGGGVLTSLLGQTAGARLASILANNQLGSSWKMALIRAETSDPEVIRAAEELLRKQGQYVQQALPAPTGVGVPGLTRPLYVTPAGSVTPVKQEAVDIGAVESGKAKLPYKKPDVKIGTSQLPMNSSDNALMQEARKYKSAEEFSKSSSLNTLNPSRSGVFEAYTPESRARAPLGENMTTLDKTEGGDPNELITVYRGTGEGNNIVPGDFVTTNKQLAQDYAGSGNVVEAKVKKGDVLDDKTEPLGEEYIYRPGASSEKRYSEADLTSIYNRAHGK